MHWICWLLIWQMTDATYCSLADGGSRETESNRVETVLSMPVGAILRGPHRSMICSSRGLRDKKNRKSPRIFLPVDMAIVLEAMV